MRHNRCDRYGYVELTYGGGRGAAEAALRKDIADALERQSAKRRTGD
jgi:hypothetical protein